MLRIGMNTFGAVPFAIALVAAVIARPVYGQDAGEKWFKGNTHTHTLWSDGNDFPDMVAAWYLDQGIPLPRPQRPQRAQPRPGPLDEQRRKSREANAAAWASHRSQKYIDRFGDGLG